MIYAICKFLPRAKKKKLILCVAEPTCSGLLVVLLKKEKKKFDWLNCALIAGIMQEMR